MKLSKGNTKAAKLTPGQVQQIRLAYDRGHISQGQLARDYGMSVNQIGRIVRREVWQDLGELVDDATIAASAQRMLQVQEEMKGQERMEEMIREARQEQTPGANQADRLLNELDGAAAERLRKLKGEG